VELGLGTRWWCWASSHEARCDCAELSLHAAISIVVALELAGVFREERAGSRPGHSGRPVLGCAPRGPGWRRGGPARSSVHRNRPRPGGSRRRGLAGSGRGSGARIARSLAGEDRSPRPRSREGGGAAKLQARGTFTPLVAFARVVPKAYIHSSSHAIREVTALALLQAGTGGASPPAIRGCARSPSCG
jgi:hypothetical protein